MSVAFLAQGVALLFGILQSLIVPKLLGEEGFGYWQLLIFYSGYTGFFHLGLTDGVYLVFGGQRRDEIDKKYIYSQFLFGLIYETFFAIIVALSPAFLHLNPDRTFVVICFAILIVVMNAMGYISMMLQAMNETKRSSYIAIISKITYLIPLVAFIALHTSNYRPYIIAYVLATASGLVYGMYFTRDFVKEGHSPLRVAARDALGNIRIGIKLMISNVAGGLVIGIVRFFIDAHWGIMAFGQLSFSLSIVTLFLSFVSQASLVLFPALRQSAKHEVRKFIHTLGDFMSLFMPFTYILYFPIAWILSLWLPQYAESLANFAFLIPICAFDSRMDICSATYFKVARKEKTLLHINLGIVAFVFVGTLIGTYLVESIDFIMMWAVAAIMLRSCISDRIVSHDLALEKSPIALEEIVITVLFVSFTQLFSNTMTIFLYSTVYALYLSANRKRVAEIFGGMRGTLRKSS